MHLTVLGCGSAEPETDTPASGLLVESGDTAVLLDCGPGVAGRLRRHRDPRTLDGIVIGHMHSDHFIDLIAIRYLFPWKGAVGRLPVFLPPGGRTRLASLEAAISERHGFFGDAFDVREYDPDASLQLGNLRMTFVAARHFVPAWGVAIDGPGGERLVFSGDTGPNETLVASATGADLLVVEATIANSAQDGPDRGHLTVAEAISVGRQAGVGGLLLTHYPSRRRGALIARSALIGARAWIAQPGLQLVVQAGGPVEGIEPGRISPAQEAVQATT